VKWLLQIACLTDLDVANTLYFSSAFWNDKTKLIYQNRLLQPALINLSANSGGVLSLFRESSIGEIELDNTDGILNFMAGYSFDGRTAILHNDTASHYLGTIERMSERGNSLFFSFKSVSETLNNPYPQVAYDSATDSPAWDVGLDGKLKPIVFGKCKNITPVLVNSINSVYQVSNNNDCRIIAVYYDGQRLTNYRVNGNHLPGVSTIAVDGGTRNIPVNSEIMFDGDDTIYTVTTGLTGLSGNIVISPALTTTISDNKEFDIINLYGSNTALLDDAAKLSSDLTKKATKWGSFRGYLHLADAAVGVVTCDAITVSGTVQRLAYDVIGDMITTCGISGITIDDGVSAGYQIIDHNMHGQTLGASVKTTVNGLGTIGYYITDPINVKELLDAMVKSFAGYYWFLNKELNIKIIDRPASTAIITINEYQIESISREALGLGQNGIPVKGWLLKYQKNWTVLTTVAGILGTVRRELLAKEYQEIGTLDTNPTTETRHLLSEKNTLESLLNKKTKAQSVWNQLDTVCSVRRDIVSITCLDMSLFDTIKIGSTINVITPLLGYGAGKKLTCIGIELNANEETILIRAFG
jgi:hypothetical protein